MMVSGRDLIKIWEENMMNMMKKDEVAKEKGELLGRYLSVHYADGYAYYEIIRVNKKTVRIHSVTEIGDDYISPLWGTETSIPIAEAKLNLKRRDEWDTFIATHKKG